MKHPYLDRYFPPMPALSLRLGYPDEALTGELISAILDTGADGTLVPQLRLDKIGAPIVDTKRIRSHWGEWRQVLVFAVDIEIDGLRMPTVEVVGDDQGNEVILGRNVLNRLGLLLDGPRKQLQVTS